MKRERASCYEIRELWPKGHCDHTCPLAGLPATPRPCICGVGRSQVLVIAARERPFSAAEAPPA